MESNEQRFSVRKEAQNRLVEKYGEMGEEQIIIHLLERLDTGTAKLNKLTIALIALTVVLAVLTVFAIVNKCPI
ncbi:MAG: hypothetical protein WC369_07215 [Dehalococcoidales bacterium]|jgi:hypothetical protein